MLAEDIVQKANTLNILEFRTLCTDKCRIFVRLKDGRQRFTFTDDSYLDIHPKDKTIDYSG